MTFARQLQSLNLTAKDIAAAFSTDKSTMPVVTAYAWLRGDRHPARYLQPVVLNYLQRFKQH